MATFDELFERPARIEDGYAPFSLTRVFTRRRSSRNTMNCVITNYPDLKPPTSN